MVSVKTIRNGLAPNNLTKYTDIGQIVMARGKHLDIGASFSLEIARLQKGPWASQHGKKLIVVVIQEKNSQ